MVLRNIMGLGLVMVLLSSCSIFYKEDQATIPPQQKTIAHASTLGDVTEERENLVGETVTVDGKVNQIIDGSTFKLEQEGLLLSNQVLVMNAEPDQPIAEGNWVRVTGEVRKIVSKPEVTTDYDLTADLDLEKDQEVEYENKPAIFAESVELLAVD